MPEIEPFAIAKLDPTEVIHGKEDILLGFDLTVVTNFPADQGEIVGMVARDIEQKTGGQVIFDVKEIEKLMEKRPKVYGFSNWKGSNWNPEGSLARKSPPPSFEKPELN